MKNLFVILLLVLSGTAFSQNSGEIKYNLSIKISDDALEAEKQFGYLKMAMDIAKKMEFTLQFNGQEAVFFQTPDKNLSSMSVYMANVVAEVPKRVYVNNSTKEYLKEQFADGVILKDNELIVKGEIINNWELFDESKQIGEYLCYKAVRTESVVTDKRTITKTYIAWYCPKIPIPFGPLGYSGLPGLIMELSGEEAAFGIKSINLNPAQAVKILKPTAGKIVSQKEFNEIFNKRMDAAQQMSKG